MADGLECQVKEPFRSACSGAADFEYEDKRYCILHLPSESKEDDFTRAVRGKLSRNDFDFGGAFFPSETANFSGAIFGKDAVFAGTVFKGKANFVRATFKGEANFFRAIFGEEGRFFVAAFSGEADFSGATFREEAYFSGATFSKEAVFRGTTFGEKAEFSGATFRESIRFVACKAFPTTSFAFEDAVIEKPEWIYFRAMHLRPSWFVNIDAQKFDFVDVEWFKLPSEEDSEGDGAKLRLEDEIEALRGRGIETLQSLRKLNRACRRLMNNAEESRDYPTANEMHYWSMEAQRKEGWSRLGLIASLYWALSGYGERPRRALWVLVGIWFAFAALYFLLVPSSPFWVFSASDAWQGLDYARQAVVYSLSALARLNPRPPSEEMDWFQTWVTLEGIVGPLQIALLVLAVRRTVMR